MQLHNVILPGVTMPLGNPAGRALARVARRMRTRDMMTFDAPLGMDERGNALGRPLGGSFRVVDAESPEGYRTVDSTGAFLVGELERLDQKLNEPLVDISWQRDVELREDVSIADETSSYTISSFGSPGGLGTGNGIGNGKAWIGKATNQVTGVSVDIAKVANPLTPWGIEVKYTVLELESSAKLGRPVDQQKYNAMKVKHQMDVDEMVYIGDTTMGRYGLVNSDQRAAGLDQVTNVTNVPDGLSGSPLWAQKTPAEILADVNNLIASVWDASAYAVMPNRILLPPDRFGYLSTTLVSQAGNTSILKYVMENNISVTSGNGPVAILPSKWTIGAAPGGTIGTSGAFDRMVAYRKDKERIRFPMTMLQRTPLQYDSIYQKTTYYCKIGVLEIVYPETIAYRDGI